MSSDKDIAVLRSINDVSAEDGKDVILTTIVPVLGTLEPETVAARDLSVPSQVSTDLTTGRLTFVDLPIPKGKRLFVKSICGWYRS